MKKTFIFLLAVLATVSAKAQMIAGHTDLALWGLQTYNVGAEMVIGNHSTISLDGFCAKNPYWRDGDKYLKVYGMQPELRYYFGGRPMYHHFVGISGIIGHYDVTWNETRDKGPAAGAGLTFGYVLPITQRLTIDAHAGLGIVAAHNMKNEDKKEWVYQLMPTKVGITLSYIFR